jgi:branched-chain amino acid transport system ATP-binding protein
MTVLENVMIGRHCRMSAGIPGAILRGRKTVKEEKQVVADSYRMLEKIGLEQFVNEFAKNLPYGAQRRLEIARAMATEPFILLLDEPAAGMNMQETSELDELILRLRKEEEIAILLIEHDMRLVMSLSDRIYVVDYGKKIAEGTPEQIKSNPAVIKAYLGEEIDA